MPRLACLVFLGAVLPAASGDAQGNRQVIRGPAPSTRMPYAVDTLWAVGGSASAGEMLVAEATAVASGPDGRIFIADARMQVVHVLDGRGERLGTVGRAGQGPGEFRLPSRVAVGPDGHLAVLDEYWPRVTEFDRDLKLVRTVLLQPRVSVRTMILTDTSIVVSGIERDPRGGVAVIHEFARTDGRRLRSFGVRPQARSPQLSRLIGAGPLSAGQGGQWWYASPGPYQIELFRSGGERLLVVERVNDFLPPAEDGFSVTAVDGRLRYSSRPRPVAARIVESHTGALFHQVLLEPGRVVTDEYAVLDVDGMPKLELVRSWVGPMPILSAEVGNDTFLTLTLDADMASGVALVRVRPRPN